MSFIVEQHAQFAADIQRLEESQAQTEKVGNTDVKIGALVDSQIQTAKKLRNLIAVVDRYFSEGRNGK